MPKLKCEGIIPERTYNLRSEMVEVTPAEYVEKESPTRGTYMQMVKEPVYEKKIITETEPEHACTNEATLLARSLEEVQIDGLHGTQFKLVGDKLFCQSCFVPGTIQHLNGTMSNHAAMSIDDA